MKYIVITGISSGIGQYLSTRIIQEGFQIIGTQRKLDHQSQVAAAGIHKIEMDLTDESSIVLAAKTIQTITGSFGLYALINNAGQAFPGPLTEIPIEKIKLQFQINVFGNLLMIQQLLPTLQIYGPGARIINMSSVSGLFASPFLGCYAASKFALEGLSDSLRRELNLLGIAVILIEPGPIRTSIWQKHANLAKDYQGGAFDQYLQEAVETIGQIEKNAQTLGAMDRPILDALLSTKPKVRYLIHKNKILFLLLAKILPDKWTDYLVYKSLKSKNKKIRPV